MGGPISFMLRIFSDFFGLDMNQMFTNGTANDILHDNKSYSQVFVVCSQNRHQNPEGR